MKNVKQRITAAACCLAIVAAPACGLVACSGILDIPTNSERLKELEDLLVYSSFANDVFGRNEFMAHPEQSFGFSEIQDPSWYGYSALTTNDIKEINSVYDQLYRELKSISFSDLSVAEQRVYRTIDDLLSDNMSYYSSDYALDFQLFGGSYISSDGGMVSDFALSFENYTFRNEDDIKYLITVTQSTKEAFGTYIDFASDRAAAGYPLYDYSVSGMISYLDDVVEQGDNYYLYELSHHMVDGAEFLSAAQKTSYKAKFDDALTDGFMAGARQLMTGLDLYKGKTQTVEKSYLGEYGAKGRAYYKWLFEGRTGFDDVNILEEFDALADFYLECYDVKSGVLAEVDRYEDTNTELYDEFYEYFHKERVYLDLEDPHDIMSYLQEAARTIVPDLTTVPEIDFKYMDETVGKRTNTVAYYYFSPIDEQGSKEYITLNGTIVDNEGSGLLTLLAHEGYPGHLYSYLNAKQNGLDLLSVATGHIAFSEGWAQYVEGAVLDYIAATTDSEAAKLYSKYDKYNTAADYVSMLLYDLEINYLGYSVDDLVEDGLSPEFAREMVQLMSEYPAVYVSYGYGTYYMEYLHDLAKTELGDKYDEVKFNGALLADGDKRSLDRAKELTLEYISSAKKN